MRVDATTEAELREISEQKKTALGYLLDAWEEAQFDGVEPDIIANAALFTALCNLIETYGEEAVAELAKGLPDRIRQGEYTLDRTTQ